MQISWKEKSKLKVFCDLHHLDLFFSLHLLFEKRLGWELYHPIGMEWWKEGYWKIQPFEVTAQQYLESYRYTDPPVIGEYMPFVHIGNFEDLFRAVRLEEFKQEKFDLIVSSLPSHIGPFNELIKEYQPQAKHIFQVGNNWNFQADVDGVMSSSKPFDPCNAKQFVFYHQEFPLTEEMRVPCANPKSIVNLLHYASKETVAAIENLERHLSGWRVSIHGAGNRDGASNDVVKTLQEHGFLIHIKPGGGGFEYNPHRAIALGRPVITDPNHFKGMTVEDLFIQDQTMFNINDPNLLTKLINCENNHEEYCQICTKQFDKIVNWDEEFEQIKLFLEEVLSH